MIFSHSWNEKRLRQQIIRQISRQQSHSMLSIFSNHFGDTKKLRNHIAKEVSRRQRRSSFKYLSSIITGHSWRERKLRQHITKQISKKKKHSNFKDLILIILVLFLLFTFYTDYIAKRNTQVSPACKPASSSYNHSLKPIEPVSFQEVTSIDINKKISQKNYSSFELNSQDLETLESLYIEKLNTTKQ